MGEALKLVEADPEEGRSYEIAYRFIGGHKHLIRLWSHKQWLELPVDEKPEMAQQIGDCWIDILAVEPEEQG